MKSKVIKKSTGPGDVLLGEGELSYLDQPCTVLVYKVFLPIAQIYCRTFNRNSNKYIFDYPEL